VLNILGWAPASFVPQPAVRRGQQRSIQYVDNSITAKNEPVVGINDGLLRHADYENLDLPIRVSGERRQERLHNLGAKHVQLMELQEVRVRFDNFVNEKVVANACFWLLFEVLKDLSYSFVDFSPFPFMCGFVSLIHVSISFAPDVAEACNIRDG
jgi:hypothetical protein